MKAIINGFDYEGSVSDLREILLTRSYNEHSKSSLIIKKKGRKVRQSGVRSNILKFLNANNKDFYSVAEVSGFVHKHKNSVSPAMNQFHNAGLVNRKERDGIYVYCINASTYPKSSYYPKGVVLDE